MDSIPRTSASRPNSKRSSPAPVVSGSASGVLNALQQLGGAIGIAVIGTVFFSIADLADAFEAVLWIEAATLVVAAILVTRLPMRARAEGTLPLDARAG